MDSRRPPFGIDHDEMHVHAAGCEIQIAPLDIQGSVCPGVPVVRDVIVDRPLAVEQVEQERPAGLERPSPPIAGPSNLWPRIRGH